MNNLIRISGDWSQEEILSGAAEQEFSHIMVIGWLKEPDEETGKRFWLSASMQDDADIIYALQHANQLVLDLSREDHE